MRMKRRCRNPYFWVGLVGVILTSLQVEASSLTTWKSIFDLVINTLSNPYLLFTTSLAVMGVVIDPTTEGLKDISYVGHLESMDDMVEDSVPPEDVIDDGVEDTDSHIGL